MRKSLTFISRIIAFFFPHIWINKLKKFRTKIYSLWMSGLPFKKITTARFVNDIQIRYPERISIGSKTSFEAHSVISVWSDREGANPNAEIIFGEKCIIGEYNHITCTNGIFFGNNLLTGKWVTITDNNHGESKIDDLKLNPVNRRIYSKGSIHIGDNVWIGDKATILANVIIGDGAVVAANSVVTKNVPAYSIVAGNPAKVLKSFN